MSLPSDSAELQREFYASGDHRHLRPGEHDHYSQKLIARLVAAVGLQSHHKVLEVGASFGRFTFELLRYCQSVVALDLSDRALAELDLERERKGIDTSRCRVVCGDARTVTTADVGMTFDAVVGLFILHHIDDFAVAIRNLAQLVHPGGDMAFLEPNRRNPLFLAQVIACPDMTWAAEKGMFTLSAKKLRTAYQDAGLASIRESRFGFFPPQVVNGFAWGRRLEERIESVGVFEPLLPFLLVHGVVPTRGNPTK